MDIAPPSFSLGIHLEDDDPPPAARSHRREPARGCAAPDPPSFSLGIDFGDDDEEEPQLPAGGGQVKRARVDAAPDAPSFSLGVDLDDDEEEKPQHPVGGRREEQARRRCEAPDAPSFSLGIDDEACQPGQARVDAAPDAPSFSLGVDLDDDEEPQHPIARRRVEQVRRRYAAPDAPSFSLRIDDDDDEFLPGGQCHEQAQPQATPRAPSSTGVEEDDDDFVLNGGKRAAQVGRDPLPAGPEASRLKRLRRGPVPPHPAPTPQVRRYEAPDAPSFSLGIDDDDEHHEQSRPQAAPLAPSSLHVVEDDDDDCDLAGDRRPERLQRRLLNPDPLPPLPLETARLKRLRRGPVLPNLAPTPPPRKFPEPSPAPPVVRGELGGSLEDEIEDFIGTPPPKMPEPLATEVSPVSGKAALEAVESLEDEIEDFTDDERSTRDVPPSVGSCCTFSNSKFSLLNHGVLMSQSATKAKISKFTQVSNSSASKSLEESCTKKPIPNITISPMRKIYLLDSDTDADDDQNQNKAKKPVSPPKKRQESMQKYMQKEITLQQNSKPQGNTTVRKSEAKLNDDWATPALDDFCNEYFKSMKDSGPSLEKEGSSVSRSKVSEPKYSIGEIKGHFQHQSSPSGAVLDEDLTESTPPAMPYFFHHDPLVRCLVRERLRYFLPIGVESTGENEQSRPGNLSYGQFGSGGVATSGRVTPSRRISVPTDVGRRRVHASGTQSGSGHWYTGEDGRKVYVSKNGQELTGQNAYRQYKKESGRGFHKYRKKGPVKKGPAKQGSSGTKRGAAKLKKEPTSAKQGTSRGKRKQ